MDKIDTISREKRRIKKKINIKAYFGRFKNTIEPYLYLLPSIFIFITFVFYPFLKTIYISLFLTDPQGYISQFQGIQNYLDLLKSKDFLNSIYVTLKFVVMTVPFSMIIAFLLSIIANVKIKGIGIFRTFYALPISISSASAAIIWMLLFNQSIGYINYILSIFNIHGIGWLTDIRWGLLSVSIVNIWLNIGINFIFMLSGLQGISKELYESAQIDGANIFIQQIKITIPMLSPTIFFLLIIDILNAFQEFGVINIMTQGGPVDSTNVMVYSIYRDAFFNFRFGSAAAESAILFIILLILTIVQFKSSEKKVYYK